MKVTCSLIGTEDLLLYKVKNKILSRLEGPMTGGQHIHLFHSVYGYYSRFFLTIECRNDKFFPKSHRYGKVDAFLERKEENQAERI